MSEILDCFALTWSMIQNYINWKDCNLFQGRRTSLMNFMIATVYLLLVLHLPLTLAASVVAHVSQINPQAYVRFCQDYFSPNCPIYGSESWECAKNLTNCTSPYYPYHCILNTAGKVVHVCTTPQICQKGTVPIYDPLTQAVSCEKCPAGHYQPKEVWSNDTPFCLTKFGCDSNYHKIECPVEPEEEYTQDTLCRCDARNDYILSYQEERAMCVPGNSATCVKSKCQDGQERLLNYTCGPRCEEGYQRDDRDNCIPIMAINAKTTTVNSIMTVGEQTSPTTTYSASTSSSEKSSKESNSGYNTVAILIIVFIVFIVLFIVGVFACWKCQLYKKCMTAINESRPRIRRQSSSGNGHTIQHHHHYHKKKTVHVHANNVTIGPNSTIISAEASTEQTETSDDNPSSSSRHSLDSQLAGSIPLLTNNQGHISVDRDASLHRNSLDNIESENTEPKRISDGTDSSQRHASGEETSRKVVA